MLQIYKKNQLLTGEMYVNHYAKRVANNNPWKIQTVFRIYRLKIAEREQVANTQSTI